jgi:hypothetical protein
MRSPRSILSIWDRLEVLESLNTRRHGLVCVCVQAPRGVGAAPGLMWT